VVTLETTDPTHDQHSVVVLIDSNFCVWSNGEELLCNVRWPSEREQCLAPSGAVRNATPKDLAEAIGKKVRRLNPNVRTETITQFGNGGYFSIWPGSPSSRRLSYQVSCPPGRNPIVVFWHERSSERFDNDALRQAVRYAVDWAHRFAQEGQVVVTGYSGGLGLRVIDLLGVEPEDLYKIAVPDLGATARRSAVLDEQSL